MDRTSSPTSPRDRAIAILAVALAALPPLVAIYCVDVLPTLDGPKNLYAAHVRFHLDQPRFAAEFEGLHPVSAFGFGVLYGALERLVSWKIAYQLSWALCILGMCAAFLVLARALHPRRWPIGVAGFGVAMQWAVYMGFANYVASLGAGLCALAVGLATPAWTVRREAAIGLLLLFACAFHPMGAQLAGAGLFAARALDTPPGLRLRRLGALCVLGAPAMFVTLASSASLDQVLAEGRIASKPLSLSARESLENFAVCFLPGPAARAWPLLACAALGLALGAADAVRRRRTSGEAALLLLGVGAAVAAMLAPFHGQAWQYVSPRFIPIAALFGVALLPVERLGRRAFQAAIVLAYGFDVLSNGWAAAYNVGVRERWREAFAGLGAPSRKGSTLLPILAVPDFAVTRASVIPYASPLRNLGELYGVDRDAIAPYSFSALPGIHLIKQRGALLPRVLPSKTEYGAFFVPGVDPVVRRREVVRLASFGVDYDEVLFVGAPDDAQLLVGLGYEPEVRDGGFLLARWAGCRAELRVTGGTAPLSVSLGWPPSDRVAWEARGVEAGVVRLPAVSCEGIWVRVVAGDARCAGADANGALTAPTTRDAETVIECRLSATR
jgi:hypothetical protein